MKNFDIEKLERKNIYQTPEDFFGKMQQNVLAQTNVDNNPQQNKAKIFTLNWGYAVAASLVLLFGMLLFWQTDTLQAENNSSKKQAAVATIPAQQVVPEATVAYQTLEEDLQNIEKENPTTAAKETPKLVVVNEQPSKKQQPKTQPQPEYTAETDVVLEDIISEFPNREIADLTRATEQDVYLDLYN